MPDLVVAPEKFREFRAPDGFEAADQVGYLDTAPIEVLHYAARDAYGKSIEIVVARASDEPAATRIVKLISPINAVATRSGRVAILSAKPLDPDVMAKIADCLAKGSWS